jgi:hypothetical protein
MPRLKLAGLGAHGLVKDTLQEDLPPEAWTDVRNVRFNSQGAKAFSGHRRVLSPASIQPKWIRPFPPLNAPYWVYADETSVWAWRGEHFNLTRLSGPYTATADERWQGEVFNGVGIFNNVMDVPQVWPTIAENYPLEDLPNWPEDLRCKWLRSYKNFLIAGYMIENGVERPFRVRWSHPAAPGSVPDSWALFDPTKDSGEVDLADSPDYLVDGLTLGETFIVYKEKTVWAMQYVGGQQIFNFWQVMYDRGLLWRDCALALPGGHFVAGQDDIYIHTGQRGSEKSVVQDRLRKWVYNQLSPETFFNCFAMLNIAETEAWFCFPEAGETYATLALVWNWRTNSSGLRDLPRIPFAYAGVINEELAAATWGGNEVYGTSRLEADDAIVESSGIRETVGSGALLVDAEATFIASGDVQPPTGPAGGTYRATYNVPTTIFTFPYPFSPPLDIGLLSWVRDGGGDNNGWRTEASTLILSLAGGQQLRGNPGDLDPDRFFYLISAYALFSGSWLVIEMNGREIYGIGGRGGYQDLSGNFAPGNMNNVGFPWKAPECFYGMNGDGGYPILVTRTENCKIIFRNGLLFGSGGGGGSGASEYDSGVIPSYARTIGGGGSGGAAYGERGFAVNRDPDLDLYSYANAGGLTTPGIIRTGLDYSTTETPALGGIGGATGEVGNPGQPSPIYGYPGGAGGIPVNMIQCVPSTTVEYESISIVDPYNNGAPAKTSAPSISQDKTTITASLGSGETGHIGQVIITITAGAIPRKTRVAFTTSASPFQMQTIRGIAGMADNEVMLSFYADATVPSTIKALTFTVTDFLNRTVVGGELTIDFTRTL